MGALFAGPIAAVVVAMLDTFFERWQRSSRLYPNYPPTAPAPLAGEGGGGADGPGALAEGERVHEQEAGATQVGGPSSTSRVAR